MVCQYLLVNKQQTILKGTKQRTMSASILRLLFTIGGALLLGGLVILILGGDQRYGGAVYHGWSRIFYGLSFLVAGCVLMYVSLRKLKYTWRKGEIIVICPRCESLYEKSALNDQLCPHCNIPMEPLKGFYDRHPEFRK